jgi:hypothetical protein
MVVRFILRCVPTYNTFISIEEEIYCVAGLFNVNKQ